MQWLPVVVAAACGVNYGYQPADDGTMEYIIQIEPALLNELRNGQPITSVLPAEVQPIGRFRIVVGTEELPRQRQESFKPPIDSMGPSATRSNGTRLAQGPSRYGANRSGVADNGVRGSEFSDQGLMQPPTGNDAVWPPDDDPPTGNNDRRTDAGLIQPAKNGATGRLASNGKDRGAGYRTGGNSDAPTVSGQGGLGDQNESDESRPDNKDREARTGSDERPWTMFLMTLVALFGSLGANLYLGWVLWDTHRRYFDVLDELQSTRGAK